MAISSRYDLQTGKSALRSNPLTPVLAKHYRSIRRTFYDCKAQRGIADRSPSFKRERHPLLGKLDLTNAYLCIRQSTNASSTSMLSLKVCFGGYKVLIQDLKIINFYMVYGGTNWGHLAFPRK
jgi:hypothetical protein